MINKEFNDNIKFIIEADDNLLDALKNNKSIIFEISEKDYYHRDNIIKMLDWAKKVIKDEI